MAPLHLPATSSSPNTLSSSSSSCGARPRSPNASRSVVQSSFQKSLPYNHYMSRDSLIIRVLALLVALMILGVQHQRYHQQQKQPTMATSSLASPSSSSNAIVLDPLLQEPPAIAPWENPSSDSLAFAKVMAEHPLMVLDVVLIVGLHTTTTSLAAATTKTRWVLQQQRQQTEFLRRAMTWWRAKRSTPHRQASSIRRFSVVLAKALKRTLKGAFKTIQRLYKNRSKYSTLSDYTWYVNTTTNTTTGTATAKEKPPTTTTTLE